VAPAGRAWRSLTLAWAAVVAVLTLLPADRLPPTPAWRLLSFDTAAHAGVFVVLALPLRRWWRAAGGRQSVVGTFVVALAYGALIECLQMTMALGRHGEWSDLLSDGLGALAGVALAGWPWRRN
jgi:VanZ family protein